MKKCVTHHYGCDCREAMFEQMRIRSSRLEGALKVAMSTLEQIATTPRNRGAKSNASATLAFLQTQIEIG